MEKHWSRREVAEKFAVSERLVDLWRARGLKVVRLGRLVRIRERDLRRFFAKAAA